MTEDSLGFGTRFMGEDGKVILFLQHSPPALIIPEGIEPSDAAREFVRLANELFLK